ncbi:xylose transporter [Nitzschia inconspicua]|uniref:Hexose transporter 1 n=1 Tax=Nitzschia inconspicua TaxID=303405 RepID=A0A9K3LZP4_9STRA|nr:xylose transporter [Nitzschia inconspicua]
MHGLVISMAIWGTVIGSIIGAWPTEILGRTYTLFLIGVLYVVSAIWSAEAGDEYQFMVARAVGGLGVGISTVTSPLYNSEISPPQWRGRLAGLFQFQICVGILIAYCSNAIIMALIGESRPEIAWRWMMGVAAVPASVYTFLSCGLPESPRWLITHRQDHDAALSVLQNVQPDASSEELQATVYAIQREADQDNDTASHDQFLSRRLARPIFLAITIGLFNQLSGINAILYFAPRVFEMAGLGAKNALMQSIGIGITNLVFTFLGLSLIDRLGRRTLLIIGTIGYIVTLLTCAFGFWARIYSIVPWALFGFIGAHAIGQGSVIFVYLAEIFPTKYRSKGQGLGSFSHWINAALISTFFPEVVDSTSPQFTFFMFAIFMMVALVWVVCCVPETKGVPLEEIGKVLGFDVDEDGGNTPILSEENGKLALASKNNHALTMDDEGDDSDDDVFVDEQIEMGKMNSGGAP